MTTALEEYAKLAEDVEWPEWDGPGTSRMRIQPCDPIVGTWSLEAQTVGPEWHEQYMLLNGNHVALCIWQNHVRRWLDGECGRVMTQSADVQGHRVWQVMCARRLSKRFFGRSLDEPLISAAKWVAEQKIP